MLRLKEQSQGLQYGGGKIKRGLGDGRLEKRSRTSEVANAYCKN